MQNNVDFRTKYQLALNDQERYDLFDRLAYNYLKSNPADYPKIVGIYEYMKKLDSKKINALEDKIVSTEDEFLHQKTKRLSNNRNDIGSYIKKLKDFRGTVKEKLKFLAIRCAGKVEDDHLITRYGEIRKLYGTINDFFIGKDGLVKSLISQCINELGVLPKIKCQPVKYAVFGLGSMALGTMTPWSDLEFAVLVNDEKRQKYNAHR